MSAARNTLDSIYDSLRAGVPPTARTTQRSLAALRDLREQDGDAVARDYRAKLQSAALARAGRLMSTMQPARGVGASPHAPRGVVSSAAELKRMQRVFEEDMRARGIRYN